MDQTFPKGIAFAQWLVYSGASAVAGQVPIGVSRHDFFTPIAATAQEWLYATNPDTDTPLHYTFDTPVGTPAASQCGRVLYSDFHVTDVVASSSQNYPTECTTTPMTAQEKVLEFMIFDLASCIQGNPPPPPPTCKAKSCADEGIGCGPAGDGCGNVIECGNCAAVPSDAGADAGFITMACGAGGPSTCGPVGNPCTPTTCAVLAYQCGYAGDGCGNLLDCGPCVSPLTCGGGGASANDVRGAPMRSGRLRGDAEPCGMIADGCGSTVSCGDCAPPDTCGGGGIANECGSDIPR